MYHDLMHFPHDTQHQIQVACLGVGSELKVLCQTMLVQTLQGRLRHPSQRITF